MEKKFVIDSDAFIVQMWRSLQELGWDHSSFVTIEVGKNSILVTPVRDPERDAEFEKIMKDVFEQYHDTFKALSKL